MHSDSQTNGVRSWANRRDAFKTLALGTFAAPMVVTSKSRAETMGAGEHLYEVVHDWPSPSNSVELGYTHGVVVDRQGRIIVFNQSMNSVAFFDPDGKFMHSWGERFAAGAHGLHLHEEDGEEFLYLTDYVLRKVVKASLDGDVVMEIGIPRESGRYANEEEYRPTTAAVGPNGDIFIGDGYGKSWIHQYNRQGEYIRTFGGPGKERGQTSCPHGLWIDRRSGEPLLLAADRANIRLQYFSLDGNPLDLYSEELRYPCDFDIRGDDLLIPDLYGRVTIFDKENRLVAHLGDNPGVESRQGYPNLPHDQRILGKFISPHAARWDHEGNIYVVEWVSDGRITKLRRVSG